MIGRSYYRVLYVGGPAAGSRACLTDLSATRVMHEAPPFGAFTMDERAASEQFKPIKHTYNLAPPYGLPMLTGLDAVYLHESVGTMQALMSELISNYKPEKP